MQRLLFTARFDAFLAFYRESPEIYREFVKRALEIRVHHERWGARYIIEDFRRETGLRSRGEFKFNNNHTPYLARLAMLRNQQLRGFFETRPANYDIDDQSLLEECDRIDRARTEAAG